MSKQSLIKKRIKQLRQVKGYSQSTMARSLSISQSAYQKLENGNTAISVDQLYRIAEIFEVTTDSLANEKTNHDSTLKLIETVKKLRIELAALRQMANKSNTDLQSVQKFQYVTKSKQR